VACKGGSGFVQAIGLLHVLCRIIFPGMLQGKHSLGVLQQQWVNGRGSVLAVNGNFFAYICTQEIRGAALAAKNIILKSGHESQKMNIALASIVVLPYC